MSDSSSPSPLACRSPRAWLIFLLPFLLVLSADLWLKEWAFAHVASQPVLITPLAVTHPQEFWRQYPHAPIVLLPKVLSLHLMTNIGAVFGLGAGGRWFFILVSCLATFLIPFFFARSRSSQSFLHLALALILAGALGNLYDRAVFGCVRDMLWLFPDWPLWPWIFNIADASLMIGVGIILLQSFRSPRQP